MEDKTTILKYSMGPGLILGIIFIVFSVVTYILGMNPIDDQWMAYAQWAITAIGIYYYQRDYKLNHNDGLLSYGEGIKLGVTIVVIAGILGSIYSLVFTTIIDPGYMDMIFMKMEAMILKENPELTQQQVDVAMGMQKKFMAPAFTIPVAIISSAVSGLIFSLIITLFNKKSNAPV